MNEPLRPVGVFGRRLRLRDQAIAGTIFFVLFFAISLSTSNDAVWRDIVGAAFAAIGSLLIIALLDFMLARAARVRRHDQ